MPSASCSTRSCTTSTTSSTPSCHAGPPWHSGLTMALINDTAFGYRCLLLKRCHGSNVRVRVFGYVRGCMHGCVRGCVRVCVHACACVRVCVPGRPAHHNGLTTVIIMFTCFAAARCNAQAVRLLFIPPSPPKKGKKRHRNVLVG